MSGTFTVSDFPDNCFKLVFEWDYPWLGLYYARKGFGSVTL